jgi:hypothetical protein
LPFSFNQKNLYQTEYRKEKNEEVYNTLIEKAMLEFIRRYNLEIKDPRYLYWILFEMNIKENKNKMVECGVQVIGNLFFVFILYQLATFLTKFTTEGNIKTPLFPLIGWLKDEKEYYTCQANYILPQELNVHLLVHDILDEKDMDHNIYQKIYKAYRRISYEMLEQYNPVFEKVTDQDNNSLQVHLKDNKIYQKICKICKEYGSLNIFDKKNYESIKEYIENTQNIPYEEKVEMYEYLKHIRNTLKVNLFENKKYENDWKKKRISKTN